MMLRSTMTKRVKLLVFKSNTEFVEGICKYIDRYQRDEIKVTDIYVYNGSNEYFLPSEEQQILKQHLIKVNNLDTIRGRASYKTFFYDGTHASNNKRLNIFMGYNPKESLLDSLMFDHGLCVITFDDFLKLLLNRKSEMYRFLNIKRCYLNNIINLYS